MDTGNCTPRKPPPGLNFNRLLLRLAKQIPRHDVNVLKGCLPYFCSADVVTSNDVFNTLCDQDLLSNDNVDILKDLLFRLNREDLIKEALSVWHKEQSNLSTVHHFDEKSDYRQVKFTFSRNAVDRTCIEDLRLRVSNMTFAPMSHILVSGITMSPCVVTLAIPDLYVKLLDASIDDRHETLNLFLIGVETVDIDRHILIGGSCLDTLPTEQVQRNLLNDVLSKEKKLQEELQAAYERQQELEKEIVEKRQMEKALQALEENSGMSTTLFKTTGRLDKNMNRPRFKPKKSQEDVKCESLYFKVARIYPQIKTDNLTLPCMQRPYMRQNVECEGNRDHPKMTRDHSVFGV